MRFVAFPWSHSMKKSLLLVLGLLLGLAGCATLSGLEPPSVHVANINLSNVTLFEQQYKLGLRLQNPNDVDLAIEGLSFEIELNDQAFAQGVSRQGVTVPRYGTAMIEVEGFSTLGDLLRQYKQLAKGDLKGLRYRMKGKLSLGGGVTLPFDRKGEIGLPEADRSGAPAPKASPNGEGI
jgi:LEA14-like dessication related protein